jgi:hypothetical protein
MVIGSFRPFSLLTRHNAFRRNEAVASDYFLEVAICTNGQTMAQILLVALRLSLISSECLLSNSSILSDVIRSRGSWTSLLPTALVSRSQTDCRHLTITMHHGRRTSLPTPEFRRTPMESLQAQRRLVHELEKCPWIRMATTFEWIADVMNTPEKSLNWRPPLQVLTAKPWILASLLCFLFWDVVYVTRQTDGQYHGQIGSEKTSEIVDDSGILQTRWTRPYVQDSYRRRRVSIVRE